MENNRLVDILEQLGSYVDMEETEEAKAMNEEERIYKTGKMTQTGHAWKEVIVQEITVPILGIDLHYVITKLEIEDANEEEQLKNGRLEAHLLNNSNCEQLQNTIHEIVKNVLETELKDEKITNYKYGSGNMISVPTHLYLN